jgi:HJR/Mrr/RecB family endonuclease
MRSIFGRSNEKRWSTEQVKNLDWRDLELIIGAALENKGYSAEVTQPTNDGGKDVDADKIDILRSILFRPKIVPRRKRLIIDAKQWNTPVGSNPVQEIADTANEEDGTGVIAAPSGFRKSARDVAKRRGVKLYDGDRIVSLLNETNPDIEEIK